MRRRIDKARKNLIITIGVLLGFAALCTVYAVLTGL